MDYSVTVSQNRIDFNSLEVIPSNSTVVFVVTFSVEGDNCPMKDSRNETKY